MEVGRGGAQEEDEDIWRRDWRRFLEALDVPVEPEDSEDQEEKPKPAASGEAHQPRTDAEIGEGGSLFDL